MEVLSTLFTTLTLVSSVLVIHARNPVYSVVCLVLAFCNGAGVLVMLGLTYFGLLLVVVYVGAIAVLFLFVVMMLEIPEEATRARSWGYVPLGTVVGALVLLEILVMVGQDLAPVVPELGAAMLHHSYQVWAPQVATLGTVEALGTALYTGYVTYVWLAGAVLLVAMVGAIVLTLQRRVGVHRQQVSVQHAREWTKTVGTRGVSPSQSTGITSV